MKTPSHCSDVLPPLERQREPGGGRDWLTGLPDYGLFRDLLARALQRAARSRENVQVGVLDLDLFKRVNAWLGHDAGDSVLQDVAWRLSRAAGPATVIARENADKFLVLLERTGAAAEAEWSGLLAAVFGNAFEWAGTRFHLTCCVGQADYPGDGRSVQALLTAADRALGCARAIGPGMIQRAGQVGEDSELQRFQLGLELRDALARNLLQVHYQPQIDLASGRITGVEALVRWTTAEGTQVSPALLVEAAEECGLICALGDWVLRTACRQLMRWHQLGFSGLRVAVNLSARQVGAPGLVASVLKVLRDTGIDPAFLDLELTESVLMRDIDRVNDCLYSLKAHGIRLCLDDFGTGYSSLAYLRSLPVEVLKVDRAFLRDVPQVESARAIFDAIVTMAHALNLRVIAEGVESEAQYRHLKAAGCDEAQGFLLSVPLPADDLTALLRHHFQLRPGCECDMVEAIVNDILS